MSPDFQNPPAQPNFPPYFVDSFPTRGDLVKAPAPISVDISDPNRGDTLYVRWVSDYPRFTGSDSKLLVERSFGSTRDAVVTTIFSIEEGDGDCLGFAAFPPGATHRLTMIVSDRPFLDPDEAPDPSLQFNYVEQDASMPQMATWIITDCP